MYCRECGKPLLESDKFCSNCGTPVKKIVPAEEPMFKTEAGSRPSRTKTAPLPSFTVPEPAAEEPKGERMIFEAIGDSIKWDTDIFPDKSKGPKKTEDVDFHWNLSEDEFRNRPAARTSVSDRSEPSLWSDREPASGARKSTGLKPSDTNSWDELFEGTRADDKNTRQAPGVGRSSVEAYWEDMFRRGGADKKASRELPERSSHRVSISRDDIRRGIGDEGSERLDQNKLEDTMTLSRSEMEGAIREERDEKTETRENREVAELASLAAAGIGAGPTFVPEGVDAVTLPEEKAEKPAADEHEITGEELERELFADMEEPMTEAQKMRARQTEKIDKFYTFNKKNEEFQKLLDQEYERFKQSREEDDLAADLYKLGDESFFEDHSHEVHSQAEEMARARQTLFHTDEFAALKDLQKETEEPAEEAAEEPAVQVEEMPAEESPVTDEPVAEEAAEVPETEEAEEAAEKPAPRREKKKKSFLGKLFGKDDDDEAEEAAVAAAAAAAGLTGLAAAEEPGDEETPAEVTAEAEEKTEAAQEEPAEEAIPAEEEEPETASIVFEPEPDEEPEKEPAEEKVEEPVAAAPAEETVPAPAEEPTEEAAPAEETAEEPAEEDEPEEAEPAEEEPEEDIDMTKTASIVFEPEQDEPVVNTEPAAPEEEPAAEEKNEAEQLPRTTEPTRVYEKGDIPSPTTEEERASKFEESRAEAWDAFFSDDEDVNAGNTFDAEDDVRPVDGEEDEKHGASIAVSILAVILVVLLALIVIRLAMPDSLISIKLDQITEKILSLFNGGMAGSLLHHIM